MDPALAAEGAAFAPSAALFRNPWHPDPQIHFGNPQIGSPHIRPAHKVRRSV